MKKLITLTVFFAGFLFYSAPAMNVQNKGQHKIKIHKPAVGGKKNSAKAETSKTKPTSPETQPKVGLAVSNPGASSKPASTK